MQKKTMKYVQSENWPARFYTFGKFCYFYDMTIFVKHINKFWQQIINQEI